MKITATLIRRAREARGESQAEFGKRFGVGQTTVSNWEMDGPPDRGAARVAIERVLADLRIAS